MKRILLPLLLCFTFLNCKDDCDPNINYDVDQDQLAIDIAKIDDYLEANNITATEHPSGIHYVVEKEGDGGSPGACSVVTVTYEGFLLTDDDDAFDYTVNFTTFGLDGGLISGWKIGVPLMKNGSRVRFFIPSVYGYGTEGSGSNIPPNANLIFSISLWDYDN